MEARHAYLIMAHHRPDLLERLLAALDDERNDIYLHIDAKAEANMDQRRFSVRRAKLRFIPRMKVHWGGYSQIACELALLEAALAEGDHSYYHLLTGASFPLFDQDHIHAFFVEHAGKEFVAFDDNGIRTRVSHLHLFNEKRLGNAERAVPEQLKLHDMFEAVQERVGYDHLQRFDMEFFKGFAYWSITQDFARYVVRRKGLIEAMMGKSHCGDEIFLHTLLQASPFAENNYVDERGKASGVWANTWELEYAGEVRRDHNWYAQDLGHILGTEALFALKFEGPDGLYLLDEIERRRLVTRSDGPVGEPPLVSEPQAGGHAQAGETAQAGDYAQAVEPPRAKTDGEEPHTPQDPQTSQAPHVPQTPPPLEERFKVSVIVPVYNVEALLPACIDSIRSQTFRNLEIILVDDGSTDLSGVVCDALATRDERIQVIHQENKGASAARNAGLDRATGDWISFVDGDDTIMPTMIEELLELACSEGVAIAECDFEEALGYRLEDRGVEDAEGDTRTADGDDPTGAKDAAACETASGEAHAHGGTDLAACGTAPGEEEPRVGVIFGRDLFLRIFEKEFWTVVQWNKIYMAYIFDGLRFPEGLYHEDEHVIHHEFLRTNALAWTSRKLYRYYRHAQTITLTPTMEKRLHAVQAFYDRLRTFRRAGFAYLSMVAYNALIHYSEVSHEMANGFEDAETWLPEIDRIVREAKRQTVPLRGYRWIHRQLVRAYKVPGKLRNILRRG